MLNLVKVSMLTTEQDFVVNTVTNLSPKLPISSHSQVY